MTEDYLLTLRLRAIGYRTVYLNEPLSLGLAPEGLKEYVSQRSRWASASCRSAAARAGRGGSQLAYDSIDRVILPGTFLYWCAAHAFRVAGLIIPILYLLSAWKRCMPTWRTRCRTSSPISWRRWPS